MTSMQSVRSRVLSIGFGAVERCLKNLTPDTPHLTLCSHHLQQRIRHVAWRDGDTDAGGFERGNLRFCCTSAATDNRACMSHAATGRCRGARDESGHGFLTVLCNPLGGFFFGRTANLTDHDDAGRFRVVVEKLDDIEMRRAV